MMSRLMCVCVCDRAMLLTSKRQATCLAAIYWHLSSNDVDEAYVFDYYQDLHVTAKVVESDQQLLQANL